MLNALIVDDEWFAIQAIVKSVDFASLGIGDVYHALGANEAKDILRTRTVDLMICDIEMPGTNGLELAEWANEHVPQLLTVFLTGHAEFSYAQQAVRLAGFAYLLKPIKPEQLAETLAGAVAKIREERAHADIVEAHMKYRIIWESQKAVVIEHYWLHVLSGRIVPTRDNLRAIRLPLAPDSPILPILISIEAWHRPFSLRDEEIMEYALRNAAAELILRDREGAVVKDAGGILLALVYGADGRPLKPDDCVEACRSFIDACERYFYCTVSCYIGREAPIAEAGDVYRRLIELEQDNVLGLRTVRCLDEAPAAATVRAKPPAAIPWDDWVVLFETGNRAELLRRLDEVFDQFRRTEAGPESAHALYHALWHMIYHVAHKNGLSLKEWSGLRESGGEPFTVRTLPQLKAWAERLIDTASRHLRDQRQESTALIERTKRYIQNNLKDATREKAAASVYLNPAYLSRLFKRETGQTLIDYMTAARIDRAKLLLAETNMRVVDICEAVGYDNYSHFGQAFKKKVGLSPQEYRRRYRQLDSK